MKSNINASITSEFRAQVIADAFFDHEFMRNIAGSSAEARKTALAAMIKKELDCHASARV